MFPPFKFVINYKTQAFYMAFFALRITIYVKPYIVYMSVLTSDSKFVLVTFNDNLLTLTHSDKFCKSLLTT